MCIRDRKVIAAGFTLLVLGMMFPSLMPTIPGMSFLAQNSYGLALFAVAVLAAVRIKGKAALAVPQVVATNLSWGAYFIIVAAILLGNVLTNDSTGVSAFLKVILSPIFQGMSAGVFTILLLAMAVLLTNRINRVTIGLGSAPACAQ